MARVTMYAEIEAPPEEVWQTLRAFDRPDRFLAAVSEVDVEGDGVGSVRTLTLEDGRQLVERLEEVDDAERTLRYSLVESPLPMRNYVSTMKVKDREDGGCEVEWACRYRPAGATAAEVKASIQDLYSLGFNGLKELHEG